MPQSGKTGRDWENLITSTCMASLMHALAKNLLLWKHASTYVLGARKEDTCDYDFFRRPLTAKPPTTELIGG